MIASPTIINTLSFACMKALQAMAIGKDETLGYVLKTKRGDVGKSGPQIAKEFRTKWGKLGRSQPWLSQLENDSG